LFEIYEAHVKTDYKLYKQVLKYVSSFFSYMLMLNKTTSGTVGHTVSQK